MNEGYRTYREQILNQQLQENQHPFSIFFMTPLDSSFNQLEYMGLNSSVYDKPWQS